MPITLAQDAIALLIEMAERGEIDPWDVKVVDVIDRFLSELNPFENSSEPYESNLSQSGQAFLYASMLLLLKAESLTQNETDTDADAVIDEAVELMEGEAVEVGLPPFLERRLQRRAVARPPQKRRVTLKELIDQLQTIATALEDGNRRSKRLPRPRQQSRQQAIRAIAQLAHQENLSELAAALAEFLTSYWKTVTDGQQWLDFELLLELWSEVKAFRTSEVHAHGDEDAETASQRHDRVGVFWALLLLTAQSKVELEQESFYQDLKIRLTDDLSITNLPDWVDRVAVD
ncbi:MAG TPA: segregation/condensation protein A [Leptolyngbyaceae cyanobacterium M33_DOE_097]|uniref:Segregation and condensation protein A n=1 Tax=Oscillatoriales cyanobacterium SpSt-418 TaxID=2282169 RepID=A0A7C3KH47_9CYAN|nr:segregation/condensation protein A [Leptolyngbyaceae cyanobacterium M33_DOE_097]